MLASSLLPQPLGFQVFIPYLLLVLETLLDTYTVRVLINQTHSEHHGGNTVKSSQILSVSLREISWLLPPKQYPDTDHVRHKEGTVEDEVSKYVADELVDYGHQGTKATETSSKLEETNPNQDENKTGHSRESKSNKSMSVAKCFFL